MIKTFKDFDGELKGQKIYEEIDKDIHDENEDAFVEDFLTVPNLLSDDKFLLKISRIVLKKLRKSGLGTFGVHPVIVNIDNVPGVYFYNYDNPSMNIVICRNTQGKHVYLFKEFNMGVENVADLVLSTTKLGFSDIIDAMISNLTPDNIEEAWSHKDTYGTFTDEDVARISSMDASIRSAIVDLFSVRGANTNNVYKAIIDTRDPLSKQICDEINKVYGKINDAIVKRVSTVFNYALGKRSTGDADMDNNIKDVLTGITSAAPESSITSATGVSAMIDDGTISKYDDDRKKVIEKDTKDYMKDMKKIYDTASMMCKYVKQNGILDKNDWGVMVKRGMLITGKAGAGKSHSIKQALKDNHMKKNIDYFFVSSGSTAAQSIYKRLYDYNGKLVIFDDSAGLFDAPYKVAFWKNALEADITEAVVELSAEAKDGEKIGNNIYVPGRLSRQERYYAEVGASSRKEKEEFISNAKDKLKSDFLKDKAEGYIFTKAQENQFAADAQKMWTEHEEQKKPKMPNRFNYKGVVIIISNKSRESFKKEVGGTDDWEAITRRMKNIDLHPMVQSMWAQIKDIILKQTADTSLTDDERIIPAFMVEEFIKEVESLMESPQYHNINFGMISDDICKIVHSEVTIDTWKDELKNLMDIKKLK